MLTKVGDEDGRIEGEVSQKYSNFTRIHNSTVSIDGLELPSMSVRLEPAEPDNSDQCSN